jgi:hypothetical protein
MKIYHISQDENNDYDTYSAMVVAAANEVEAAVIHPDNGKWDAPYSTWCSSPAAVTVKYLGEAAHDIPAGVLLASFHAG